MISHTCLCGLNWWIFKHRSDVICNGHLNCSCGRLIASWDGKVFFTIKRAVEPKQNPSPIHQTAELD